MVAMKRGVASFLFAVIILLTASLTNVASAQSWDMVAVEQHYAVLPEIKLYFYPLDSSGEVIANFEDKVEAVSAVLENKSLSVKALQLYDDGTVYYFLVDISSSISSSVFKEIQAGLNSWIDEMGENDKFVLISFGEEVRIVLNGSESKAVARQAVDALKNRDKKTMFYDAIAQAIALSSSSSTNMPDRQVAVLLSDGKDVSTGGSATRDELLLKLQEADLPLYALGIGSNKSYMDSLGEFARQASGQIYRIDSKSCKRTMQVLLQRINSCYVLAVETANNMIPSLPHSIMVKIDYEGKELHVSYPLTIKDWAPDMVPPEMQISIAGENMIIVQFSEPVTGADNASNYKVNAEFVGDQNGQHQLVLHMVSYDEATNSATLQFAEPIYAGAYTFQTVNIADVSSEANALVPLSDGVTLYGDEYPQETESEGGNWVWWVVVGGGLLIIAIVVILLTVRKKRKADAQKNDSGELNIPEKPAQVISTMGSENKISIQPVGKRCQILVIERNGVQRTVSAFIAGEFVVGRSKEQTQMDIYDQQISRRHFALIFENDEIFIKDLGSQNGTTLNGSPVTSQRRVISARDVIEAGDTRFVIQPEQ